MSIRGLFLGLGLMLASSGLLHAETNIVCGSLYIQSLVVSLTGSEINNLLLYPDNEDPYAFQPLTLAQLDMVAQAHLVILHKHQKALQRAVAPKLAAAGSMVLLAQDALVVPTEYLEAARQLKKTIAQAWPYLEVYMEERLDGLKEQVQLLDAAHRAKGREMRLPNIYCLASKRQVAFVRWLGLEVLESFADDQILTASQKQAMIEKAKAKSCWLIIANSYGSAKITGQELCDALAGELLVLSDQPAAGDEAGSEQWQVLLDRNVTQIIDVVQWH